MKLSTPLTLPHASFLTFSSNWSQISQMQLTSATSDHSSCWEAQGLSTRDGSWPISAVAGESQRSHPFPWLPPVSLVPTGFSEDPIKPKPGKMGVASSQPQGNICLFFLQ